MSTDNPPAADPGIAELLRKAVARDLNKRNFFAWLLTQANSPLWADKTPEDEIARMAVDAIIPLLRSIDANAHGRGRAELRAAIQALCDETENDKTAYLAVTPKGAVLKYNERLRALLVDDGAAALRKVQERAWDECADYCWRELGIRPDESMNPYRDTAGGGGDGPTPDPRGPEYDVCPRCERQGPGQNVRCADPECGWREGEAP